MELQPLLAPTLLIVPTRMEISTEYVSQPTAVMYRAPAQRRRKVKLSYKKWNFAIKRIQAFAQSNPVTLTRRRRRKIIPNLNVILESQCKVCYFYVAAVVYDEEMKHIRMLARFIPSSPQHAWSACAEAKRGLETNPSFMCMNKRKKKSNLSPRPFIGGKCIENGFEETEWGPFARIMASAADGIGLVGQGRRTFWSFK